MFAFVIVCAGQQAQGVVLHPCLPAQFVQALVDGLMQGEQVFDVVGGVFKLRVRQRAAHPVRTRLALGQRDAGDFGDQFLVAHAATDASQRRADLGVEQWPRQRAAGAFERDQILAGAVHDLEDGGVLQPRAQGVGHAGDQWVDQQDFIAHRHLYQRQLRPVGAFTDELGVQPDARGALQVACFQFGWVFDPVSHVYSIEGRVCPGRRE